MRFRRLIELAAAIATLGALRPAQGEMPPAERAAAVLRDAAAGTDEGARLLALQRAASLRVTGLEEAARRSAASNDRVERSLGLELLAGIDVSRNRESFLDSLASPYRTVRIRGMKALLSLSDPGLAPRFIEVLGHDPDPDIRALAARGLALSSAPEVRTALREAVATGHPVVQTAAVRALVAGGDLSIGRELLERARQAAGMERRRLFELVALVPDPALVPVLASLLENADSELRVSAAAAMLSILEPPR